MKLLNKKLLPYRIIKSTMARINKSAIILIVFVAVGFMAYFSFTSLIKSQPAAALGKSNNNLNIKEAERKQIINKQFLFPVKGLGGEEVSNLKFTIENAEIRDEIIIKGQKATAIDGRTFLVLNLKITNDFEQGIQINVRDYIRLRVGKNAENLAPEIHNDPVEIQAISTKYTRLGFPIDVNADNIKIQIGEISGKKEFIELNLK